jgi:hypothetical protein
MRTSERRMNVANSFFNAIICTDMDPISRKMTMKKVAGFHPLGGFGFRDFMEKGSSSIGAGRRNLGTMDFQKEGLTTLGTAELTERDLASTSWP